MITITVSTSCFVTCYCILVIEGVETGEGEENGEWVGVVEVENGVGNGEWVRIPPVGLNIHKTLVVHVG